MKLYNMTFVFENCEVLNIDGRYIFTLTCKGLREDITSSIYGTGNDGTLTHHFYIDDFTIGVLKQAEDNWETTSNIDHPNKLDRLRKCDDLVSVDLTFWDGNDLSTLSHKSYYLNWGGNDEFINNSLRVYNNKCGDVLLSVSKDYMTNPSLGDRYFSLKYFNDKEFMNKIREARGITWE